LKRHIPIYFEINGIRLKTFQRDSFSEEPVVKKKRSQPEDDFEDSEDEMMDTEQLEKFALAQL